MEKTPLKNRREALSIKLERKVSFISSLRQLSLASSLIPFALFSTNAFAISVSGGISPTPVFPKTSIKPKSKHSSKEPVLLTAQHVDYDKEKSLVLASGKVEIVQGGIILLADKVTYNQTENIITASGNVSVLESSGNIVFADNLELKDDLKTGVINQFKARLSDDSLFVANTAKKHDENITELHQAVYSPCKVCEDEKGGTSPLWQLRAGHVLIDKQKEEVSYNDALMEIYGVPVFYTPYFSHPTPGADNKSGLLVPTFKQSTNLGTVLKQPVYYSIAKDKDITITPIYSSLEGVVMVGEYRQLFNNGDMILSGSITKPQTRDAGGAKAKGQNIRGHFDAIGNFAYDENTNWGFNIRGTSDDTYLRRYDFSNDSLLASRIYAEKYDFIGNTKSDNGKSGERSFASVQALKFDGLTAADNNRTAPIILPLVDFNWESASDKYNGRLSLDGNLMSLTREEGAQSRRLSTTAGWKAPYITSDGQVFEFAAQMRSDIYSVSDQILAGGTSYDGQVGRVIPQASLTWRYPFIKQAEDWNMLLEP
ncbi:MAG: LPS assembly protein LptD, partial [Rickettsiales bacterium]